MKNRQRVLVVEDDKTIVQALKVRLEAGGFEVHTEECGMAGVRYATANPLDLVVLDLRLPDINGYEVCKRLRHRYSSWTLPILMLTGMNEPIDQLRGFAHGADAYLTKPYDPAELLKTAHLLLGEMGEVQPR